MQAGHFLHPQVYSKGFVNNKLIFDKKLTFIDCVSQFSTGVQDDYVHAYSTYIIDVVAKNIVM